MEAAPGAGVCGQAEPLPATGDPRVDDAVGGLRDLASLPVAEHPAIFEQVHRRLTEALAETGGQGGGAPVPGHTPGGPGR